MAKLSREDIYQIYDRDFIEPILNVGKGMELNNTVAKKFVKWLADHGHPGIAEDYGAVLFMLRNKLAWRDFMNVFLGVLGVDASMHTIGSSVQRWARKKYGLPVPQSPHRAARLERAAKELLQFLRGQRMQTWTT